MAKRTRIIAEVYPGLGMKELTEQLERKRPVILLDSFEDWLKKKFKKSKFTISTKKPIGRFLELSKEKTKHQDKEIIFYSMKKDQVEICKNGLKGYFGIIPETLYFQSVKK